MSASTGTATTSPFTGVSLSELRRRAKSEHSDEARRLLRAVGGTGIPRKRAIMPSFDELLFGMGEGETETTTNTDVEQQKEHTAGAYGRKLGRRSWAQRTIEKKRESRRMK